MWIIADIMGMNNKFDIMLTNQYQSYIILYGEFTMNIDTVKTVWSEGELKQNTHIVTMGDSCIIIDAGASLDDIMPIVEDKKVEAILVTHAHYDHITYIESYQIAFDCPVYMHENSEKFLTDTELNVSRFFGVDKTFDLHDVQYIKGKETLNLSGIEVKAIFTPGHSDDSLCYLFDNDVLFTGDTVFSIAVGRTDLATGNTKRLIASLNQLLKVDFNTAYTGHGRGTTKQEQLTNIPKWIEILKQDLLSGDKKVDY